MGIVGIKDYNCECFSFANLDMKEYDLLFVTNQPSFYKVKQWNEIATKKRVLLVFIDRIEKDRNDDFVSEKPVFDYFIMPQGFWRRAKFIVNLVTKTVYKRLIVGGWDEISLLILPFISPKKKNAFLCESSFYEYQPHLVKDLIKRVFLERISVVFPAGKSQGRIFEHLGFKGEYRYTGGCGLLNYIEQPKYTPRSKVVSFLYVGRLVEVKNLEMLVSVFNELPSLRLSIIGFGNCEEKLKSLAATNITFLGPIENKRLSSYYQDADVLILPSFYEPWGLVVEEALNNGTPVIVSDKVGCRDELVTDKNGIVFDSKSAVSLREAILRMTDVVFYNSLRRNVSKMNFEERKKRQIEAFVV